jgi:hypothetical protein
MDGRRAIDRTRNTLREEEELKPPLPPPTFRGLNILYQQKKKERKKRELKGKDAGGYTYIKAHSPLTL